ncbi:MAG: gliding motility-associated C-terminal domain-containing protein [Flavobacteriales bacterium]|nr:gliding motility-associated C-terminal domain-containing protein [Flavobacteriales bacterium]
MRYAVLGIMMFFALCVSAQTNLDQNVIGSGGDYDSTSSLIISSTIGETVVHTTSSTSVVILTQGFQQSFIKDTISFLFQTFNASCIGRADGFAKIDSIKGCNAPYTILWSNGSTGTSANNLAAGDYSVQITSGDGCTKQIPFSINYISEEDCILKFYSGITPNNDGINDNWEIDNIELFPDNSIDIYNRLGNKVWEGSGYDNNTIVWGGENLSGNELPSDTYFYVFITGNDVEKGWIELTR